MNDERLKAFFQKTQLPSPRMEVREEAVRAARREWDRIRRSPELHQSSGTPWLFFTSAVAGGAVAVFLAVMLLFPWKSPDVVEEPVREPVEARDERLAEAERIFHETEALFGGLLKFVLMKNGAAKVDLAEGEAFRGETVALEFERQGETWRVVGYSGNSVEIEVAGERWEFDLLVTGDNEVLITGRDFVWTSRAVAETGEFTIRARVLKG